MRVTEPSLSASLSKSCESGSTGYKNMVIEGRFKMIDMVFPLFDYYYLNSRLPVLLLNLRDVYLLFQLFFCAMWPYDSMWDNNQYIGFLKKLVNLGMNIEFFPNLVSFVIIIVVFAMSFFFCMRNYRINHRFNTYFVQFLFLFIECVFPLLLFFAMRKLGIEILGFMTNSQSGTKLEVIVTIICSVYLVVMTILCFELESRQVFLVRHFLGLFDSNVLIRIIIVQYSSTCLSISLKPFSKSIVSSLFVVQILMIMNTWKHTLNYPFHKSVVASILQTCLIISVIIDCILFYTKFALLSTTIVIALFLLTFVIVFLIIIIYNSKKVLKKDNNNELFMIRNLFINHCHDFIDLSLIKSISQSSSNTEVLCPCLQLLSFFPGEVRLMNSLMMKILDKRDIEFKDRFLIFQINKIKVLRQSSTSHETNSTLLDLKRMSLQCEQVMKAFWKNNDFSINSCEAAYEMIMSVQSLWEETITNYPNNSKFYDEYCRFLIEVPCDFESSIVMKQKGEMVEIGKRFAVDLCFRQFVRTFPKYIKEKIIDPKGNIVGVEKNGSQKAEQFDSSSFSDDLQMMDIEMEETIGRQMFNHTKLRLAMTRALKGRKPKSLGYNIQIMLLCIPLALILMILPFQIGYNQTITKNKLINRVAFIGKSSYYRTISSISLLLNYAQKNGFLFNSTLSKLSSDCSYFDLNSDLRNSSMFWIKKSRESFDDLLSDIAYMASIGFDIYNIAKIVIHRGAFMGYCASLKPIYATLSDMGTVFSINSFMIDLFNTHENMSSLFYSDQFCEYFLSGISLSSSGFELISIVKQGAINDFIDSLNDLKKSSFIYPLIAGLILFIPLITIIIAFRFEFNHFLEGFKEIDSNIREIATHSIRNETNSTEEDVMEKNLSSSQIMRTFIYSILYFIILGFVVFIGILNVLKSITGIRNLFFWDTSSISRTMYITDALFNTIMAVILGDNRTSLLFTNSTFHTSLARSSVTYIDIFNKELFEGTVNQDPVSGHDLLLDKINSYDSCDPTILHSNLFDYYKCTSLNQRIGVFSTIIVEILQRISRYNGSLSFQDMSYALNLVGSFLLPNLEKFDDRIEELQYSYIQNLLQWSYLYGFLSIILLVIWGYGFISLSNTYASSFQVILFLLKRLSPCNIVNNRKLMSLILNKENTVKKLEQSISGSIIQTCNDSIICLGANNVIDMVNPSVSMLLGYTPEQMLGQSISLFLKTETDTKIVNQLALMKEGQSTSIYSDHIICINDSNSEIPCGITILGMKNQEKEAINSFVIILKDEGQIIKQQTECEIAKEKSESLLYQILPREIVIKLNMGDKDVSFSVPMATILFIDIVKFSDFSSHLSPQEILHCLSNIFATFDSIAEKYNLITKIKLIGDVYMAAAGLFGEVSGKYHAEQMIRFAIDTLQQLESLNVKMNSNINVRIGINTGGPIIAGVLGSDKPVFDIIGDPINVASRLQATCIPGRIQISQSTFDQIKDLNFDVEKRGEVFLKGKGNAVTYFVNPESNFFSCLSSNDGKNIN